MRIRALEAGERDPNAPLNFKDPATHHFKIRAQHVDKATEHKFEKFYASEKKFIVARACKEAEDSGYEVLYVNLDGQLGCRKKNAMEMMKEAIDEVDR
jgi:hypothetical protein